MIRAFRHLAMFLVVSSLTATAWASSNYPAVVQDELKLTSTPDCSVCHVGAASSGTATSAFAMAVKSRGATGGGNEAALRLALQALVAEKNPEVAKLQGGGAVSGPEFGCSVGASKASSQGAAFLTAIAMAGVLVAGRRRRLRR